MEGSFWPRRWCSGRAWLEAWSHLSVGRKTGLMFVFIRSLSHSSCLFIHQVHKTRWPQSDSNRVWIIQGKKPNKKAVVCVCVCVCALADTMICELVLHDSWQLYCMFVFTNVPSYYIVTVCKKLHRYYSIMGKYWIYAAVGISCLNDFTVCYLIKYSIFSTWGWGLGGLEPGYQFFFFLVLLLFGFIIFLIFCTYSQIPFSGQI